MIEPRTHLERVSRGSAIVARAFGLDPELVRAASWLHDIGMAGLRFVRRPGPLAADEQQALRRHPERGAALLRGSGSELLDLAAVITLTHHERFDGSGYPQGLCGDRIPLVGHIVAVADAYDALVTDRPHRLATDRTAAVAALEAERGGQFDPVVLDAFLERIDEVDALLAAYPAPARELITPEQAGALLGWSSSRVRRAGDRGRLPIVRTSGGHRRYLLDSVVALAELLPTPPLQPLGPPPEPIPRLGRVIADHGGELCRHAARVIYRDGPPGWFASAKATAPLQTWLDTLADACLEGEYAPVFPATAALMAEAAAHTATLLERHSFLEWFGLLAARDLHEHDEGTETAATRRLITALQQAMLAER